MTGNDLMKFIMQQKTTPQTKENSSSSFIPGIDLDKVSNEVNESNDPHAMYQISFDRTNIHEKIAPVKLVIDTDESIVQHPRQACYLKTRPETPIPYSDDFDEKNFNFSHLKDSLADASKKPESHPMTRKDRLESKRVKRTAPVLISRQYKEKPKN